MGIRNTKQRPAAEQSNLPPKKKGKLSQSFARACRRGLLATLVGIGFLTPSRVNAPSTPPRAPQPVAKTEAPISIAPTNAPSKIQHAYNKKKETPKTEAERRAEINKQLIEEARARYPQIARDTGITYSQQLDSLETALTSEIKRITNDSTKRVAVIDAYEFDVGLALGFDEFTALSHVLEKEGIPVSLRTMMDILSSLMIEFTDATGNKVYSQGPFSMSPGETDKTSPTIVLPSSDNTLLITIKGLSFDKTIELVNRHESWHVLDNRFHAELAAINMENLQDVDMSKPETVIGNEDALKYISVFYRIETSADVAALGEMLRAGTADLSIIDIESASRAARSGDLLHMSPPVLAGLRTEIEKLGGVEALKALSNDEARDFYYQVTQKYAINLTGAEYLMKMAQGDDEQKAIYRSMGETDPEIKKGIVLYDLVSVRHAPELGGKNPVIAEQLATYNPVKQMQDRAFALGGKITPETMIKAYGSLMNDMAEARKADTTQDELLTTKMSRMKIAFIVSVTTMDYVAVNEVYGVSADKLVPNPQAQTPQKIAFAKTGTAFNYNVPPGVKRIGPCF